MNLVDLGRNQDQVIHDLFSVYKDDEESFINFTKLLRRELIEKIIEELEIKKPHLGCLLGNGGACSQDARNKIQDLINNLQEIIKNDPRNN